LFSNPKPQAFTSGATVISKAPSVISEISSALSKHLRKYLSGTTGSFLLIFEITDSFS